MTKRKHFSPAFKLEIAKLMVDEKYSIKQACEASGAGETSVSAGKSNIWLKRQVLHALTNRH